MLGLYATKSEPSGARVIEYGEGYPTDSAQFIEERPTPEEARHERAEKGSKTVAPQASRAGALVVGTGLLLFFLLRH